MAASVSVLSSSALHASEVVKAASGALLQLSGYNDAGSAQFIQVHASPTLPSNGAVPLFIGTVATKGNFKFDFPEPGLPCASGIVVCNSSTAATKTIGTTDTFFTALYR